MASLRAELTSIKQQQQQLQRQQHDRDGAAASSPPRPASMEDELLRIRREFSGRERERDERWEEESRRLREEVWALRQHQTEGRDDEQGLALLVEALQVRGWGVDLTVG